LIPPSSSLDPSLILSWSLPHPLLIPPSSSLDPFIILFWSLPHPLLIHASPSPHPLHVKTPPSSSLMRASSSPDPYLILSQSLSHPLLIFASNILHIILVAWHWFSVCSHLFKYPRILSFFKTLVFNICMAKHFKLVISPRELNPINIIPGIRRK
jgi:hypothetical protein